jgi:hypothetical protein
LKAVDISKGSNQFAHHAYLENAAKPIFEALREDGLFLGSGLRNSVLVRLSISANSTRCIPFETAMDVPKGSLSRCLPEGLAIVALETY